MSIITEALKKAELEKKLKKGPEKINNTSSQGQEYAPDFGTPQAIASNAFKPYVPESRKTENRPNQFALILLVALAVVGGFFIFANFLSSRHSVVIVPNGSTKDNSLKTENGVGIEFSFDTKPAVGTPVSQSSRVSAPAPKVRPSANVIGKIFEDPANRFKLTGIINDTRKPAAIINDEIVEIGQTISGATVIQIDNETAVLEYNNRKIDLKL